MNIQTLDSMKNGDKDGDEEKKDRGGNEYYAGGAGRDGGSGLSVIGPGNDDKDSSPKDTADDIFNRATSGEAAEGTSRLQVTITMYREGFTVDDGPYRRLDDPANKPFLQDLGKGIVPRELHHKMKDGGGACTVNLQDRRQEDYVPPAYTAFSGSGQTMGAASNGGGQVVSGAAGAGEMPTVDDSQPTTSLQIRLHNGRRLPARLNLSHTIRHIQALINAEGAGDQPYVLMTGFPPAQLKDFDMTLEAAGLKGAAITQKLQG
ncbi:unnamed protein product [Chrysoparadoxa australica]